MNELIRFIQMRSPQKLTGEEAKNIGVHAYHAADSESALGSAEAGAEEKGADTAPERNRVRSLAGVHPLVRALYEWLDYKAKPIADGDLRAFVSGSLKPLLGTASSSSLEKEWDAYADALVASLIDDGAGPHFDPQLLVKAGYLVKRMLSADREKFEIQDSTVHLVNRVLEASVILPDGVLAGRCGGKKKSWRAGKTAVVVNEKTKDQCSCACDESCHPPSRHCTCLRPYIADLMIVKEELARFEMGDVAYIENILAGEIKVRKHSNFTRVEDLSESETEKVTSEERDQQVSEQFSLQEESNKTVQESVNVDAGVTVSAKYGQNLSIDAHANVAGNYAKSKAESTARSHARDVLERSSSKIEEKVRKFESTKVINKYREQNRHEIDNKGGDHRAGIFYWVNKVTRAQVFNRGKHMMIDVVLPEPAALYKKLYAIHRDAADKDDPAPVKPEETVESITRNTYASLLVSYGLTGAEAPPSPTVQIQMGLSHNVDASDKVSSFAQAFQSPQIPSGYRLVSLGYQIKCSTAHPDGTGPKDEVAVNVTVGKDVIFSKTMNEHVRNNQPNQDWETHGSLGMNGEEGLLTVSAAGLSSLALGLSGTLTLQCELKEETERAWKHKIYDLLMDDYNRRLRDYEARRAAEAEPIAIKGRNPFLNRELERNELKRHIVSILMCNTFNGLGSMVDRTAPCGYPEIDFEKLERDAPLIQFFEQVFEWNYVTYLFYHSMWARKCKWPALLDEDSGDPLFDKFLMAGAARVQVPVREGMEEVFAWFLRTGQIWEGSGVPPLPGDAEYVSIIQEIKESTQGDYADRAGTVAVTKGSNQVLLKGSFYYWDLINDTLNLLNVNNDIDREILLNFKVYRIVGIAQTQAGIDDQWTITLDRPYEDADADALLHAVGAVFVGAPWEIRVPTKLVYLQNKTDHLPVYPVN